MDDESMAARRSRSVRTEQPRRRRSTRVVAIVVAVLLAAAGLAVPAAGFSRDGTTSCGQQVKFAFDGPGWIVGSNDTRPTLRTYIDDWEIEWNYNAASRVLDVKESFGELVLQWKPDTHFSASGHAGDGNTLAVRHSCSSVHINEDNLPPSYPPPSDWYADMGRVLQHEIGHGFGFDHTGSGDSHEPSATPVMSTCSAGGFPGSSARHVAQDDYQAGQYAHGTLNPETMTANVGFNRGTSYYQTNSGTSWFTGSGGVYWKPDTSGGGYFFQTTSVSESAGDSFDAKINWRRTVNGLSGTVWVYMYARGVTYSGAGCAATNFNSGVNQNGTRDETIWYLKKWKGVWNNGGVTSALAGLETLSASMTSAFVDIQIRARHDMRYNSGSYIPLLFDNVRIRER